MRIATNNAFQQSVSNLQKRYQALNATQAQMTSGLRVQVPSDDPAAAARAVRAMASASQVSDQTRALNASKSDMQLSESALGSASTMLQQARDLVVSAGNATLTDTDRATIAQQLQGLRNDLLAQANQTDGNGRYLFGGQGADSAPFVDAPGGVVYNGVPGQQQSVSSQAMPLTVDGRAAWMQSPDPSNPGSSLSVFDALDRTISALKTPGQTSTQTAQTVSEGLASIDAVSNTISTARSQAGQALNTADSINSQLSQSSVDAQTQLTNAQDLDMTQAISSFQNQQTGYDAALKTYSLVQQMSLFQYLK